MIIYNRRYLFTIILLWISHCYGDHLYSYNDIFGWGQYALICNDGHQQSPIDLGPKAQTVFVDKLPIDLVNYELKPVFVKIMNDGHTVNLTGEWAEENPYITGDLVKGERYKFLDLHVHWSDTNHNGSEHSIWGKKYAAELHLVHTNVKYKDLEEAMEHTDGVLVFGILFDIHKKRAPNAGMYLLSSLDSTVTQVNTHIKTEVFDFSLFELDSIKSFYTYLGSLTTPPCTETVRWIIASEVFPITPQCLKALRDIKLGDKEQSNVRPTQEPHHRKVQLYIEQKIRRPHFSRRFNFNTTFRL